MTRPAFDLIAFDADDTLWHNERSYRESRDRFREILAAAGIALTPDEVEAHVNDVELRNLSFYGYGVSNFVLSLIEAAIKLSAGRITGAHIDEIMELARRMLTSDVELFPGVAPTLRTLARRYPLMLITKGDLLHQRMKLERSGLERHFRFVEVVSHKTPAVYAAILDRHRVTAARFLMVGNSLRSDILPVIKIGGAAIHIPAELTWGHEHAHVSRAVRRRYFERANMSGLDAFIEALGEANRRGRRTDRRAVARRPSRRRAAAKPSR